MVPTGVAIEAPLVYWKRSPGCSSGCAPTTPSPRTSCTRPCESVMIQWRLTSCAVTLPVLRVAGGGGLVPFDVMGNPLVPNPSVGPPVCAAIRPHVALPIDVHLMAKPVDALVPEFARAGARIISFHPEASEHVDRTLGGLRVEA